jgi:hypothetical protein
LHYYLTFLRSARYAHDPFLPVPIHFRREFGRWVLTICLVYG